MEATDLTKAEAIQKYNYAKNMVKKAKEQAAVAMTVVKTAVETGGTALLLGYWHGATEAENPDFEQFGLPTDLGVAFLCHGLAFAGVAKSVDDDLHAVGNGALAFYAARMGLQMGRESLEDKSASGDAAQQAAVAGLPTSAYRRPANPWAAGVRQAA